MLHKIRFPQSKTFPFQTQNYFPAPLQTLLLEINFNRPSFCLAVCGNSKIAFPKRKVAASAIILIKCEAPSPWLLCLAILSCPSQVLMPLASLAPGLGLMTWCCRGLPADSHGRPSASGLGLSRCGSRSHDQTSEDGGTGERRVDRRGRHWRQGEKSETFHLLLGTSITSYSQDGKQVGKEVQKELVRKF